MNESVKGAAMGAAFGGVIWATTGIWQFFAVAMVGVACTWVFTPPAAPQPRRRVREFVRVEIRDAGKLRDQLAADEAGYDAYRMQTDRLAACYNYGGCQWTGDGCAGKPLVLGSGKGCQHTRQVDQRECACYNVPCTCNPYDLAVARKWGRQLPTGKRNLGGTARPEPMGRRCYCDTVPCRCGAD
jgi:hypothetical protein